MMNMKKILYSLLVISFLSACSEEAEVVETEAAVESQAAAFSEFSAVLHSASGSDVEGGVLFSNTDDGVRVGAQGSGLGGGGPQAR